MRQDDPLPHATSAGWSAIFQFKRMALALSVHCQARESKAEEWQIGRKECKPSSSMGGWMRVLIPAQSKLPQKDSHQESKNVSSIESHDTEHAAVTVCVSSGLMI